MQAGADSNARDVPGQTAQSLLLCFTRCTDELQELHRGGGLSFLAVQVDEGPTTVHFCCQVTNISKTIKIDQMILKA